MEKRNLMNLHVTASLRSLHTSYAPNTELFQLAYMIPPTFTPLSSIAHWPLYTPSCFLSLDQRPLLLGRNANYRNFLVRAWLSSENQRGPQPKRKGCSKVTAPTWHFFSQPSCWTDFSTSKTQPPSGNHLNSSPQTDLVSKVFTKLPAFQLDEVIKALATADIWKSARRFNKGNLEV